MATSQKLTEHFLTCPVCFEVFTNPSTLACDHTFCGQCVVSYTKTRSDAVTARSLLCPFCERLTKVSDPQRPVEEWPSQMKPGLLLRGLLESFGPGSKDTTNCTPCSEGGETTSATVCDISLCSTCLKAHRSIPATRHHIVAALSDEVKVIRRPKVMCQEHKGEVIKFYCKDCKKVLCQSCCIVYHRQCKSVQTLESMRPEIKSTIKVRKETLSTKIQKEENRLKARKSRCTDIQKMNNSIQSQIRSTSQKAMDAIKKKEKKLMDELDEVTDKQMGQLKADIKTGDMAIQIYRQQSEFIDQALNSDSEMNMYHLYQSCESCESGAVESVYNTDEEGEKATRIEFSEHFDKIEEAVDGLGEIKVIREGGLDAESTPVLTRTIDCRTQEDKNGSDIYDVLCMKVNDVDTLIITDYKNSCIKLFHNKFGQPHHNRLELQSCPRRIAKVGDKTLAISLPDDKQIVTVTVFPDISQISSVKTSKKYWGLTALNTTTLAAGTQSPPGVDILDRSGNVLQSISPLYNGQKIIQNPLFLCASKKGHILVSDSGTQFVLCLTLQGDVVFKYSCQGTNLRGISSTDTGDILVADDCQHKVIQLSESFVGIVRKHLHFWNHWTDESEV